MKGKDPKLEPLLRTHRNLHASIHNIYIGLESTYVTCGDFKEFVSKLGKFVYKLILKNKIAKEKFLNLEKGHQNDNFEY